MQEASILGIESNVFINFNPYSIYDPAYCLRSTIGAIKRSVLSPDQIIFEATESEKIKDNKHLRNILASTERAASGSPSTTSTPTTAR